MRPERGLLHPGALVSIVLLVANDHWFKAAAPGLITGKLSDFAGLAFFPLFLHALVRLVQPRAGNPALAVSCALTALVFAAVKTVPWCHEAYEVGLGLLQYPFRAAFSGATEPGRVLLMKDATDLVALPAVLLAWRWGRIDAATATG